MYSEKSHRMPSLQFPSEIRVHENEFELARRKQKISENPTFHDDIEFISSQLDLIKRQRDIYKALLEQFEGSLTAQEQEVKRCQSVQVENSLVNLIKENEVNEITDKGLIDPLSPSYGKELGDRIDKLNLQIKNLKHTFEDKSHGGSPLPREFRETIVSSHYSPVRLQSPLKNQKITRLLKKKINQKRPKSSDTPPNPSLSQKKLHSKTFCITPTPPLDAPYKHSFCNVQAQLEYFPTRIRQLEQENRELERILERLNQKEMTQSTLSLDRPLKSHRKTTQHLDVKRKELENLQRQLEEKSKALESKEKELNAREMVLNRASTKGKKPKEKESKGVINNTITISNISGPEKNTDVHYEDQNQLKKMMQRESKDKEKKDEEPEKGYACKVCRVF